MKGGEDMPNSSFLNDERHSTTESSKWDAKQVAICALFSAAAIATSYISIPIFPAAPFLKYDPSGIICLLAVLLYGTKIGAVVVTLPWVIRAFTNPAGALMSFVIGLGGILVAGVLSAKIKGAKGVTVALIVSAIVSVILAIIMNLIVTPAFSGVPVESVLGMIVPILLPFNIVKFAINSVVAGIVFAPLKRIIK